MFFRFKMEKVLKYKDKIETEKKEKFGRMTQELYMQQQRMDEVSETFRKTLDRKNEILHNGDIVQLRTVQNYISKLKRDMEDQEKLIEECKKQIILAKDELMIAMQERKSFEKLKEKDYREFLFNQQKADEKLTDSMVTFQTVTENVVSV